MATATPVPASAAPRAHSRLFNILSKLRSKSKNSKPSKSPQASNQDTRPPLLVSPLPLVLPHHQPLLAQQGWTTITFPHPSTSISFPSSDLPPPGPHPLQAAYESLFRASEAFFALPPSEKEKWRTKLGSEEGWSKIEGEKEFITIRTLEGTPDVLKGAASAFWGAAGELMEACLERVGRGLGMEEGREGKGLTRFVGPCKRLGDSEADKTATMLRLFRYEGEEPKVVAEPHADLGLLSLVIGASPGLEVWNTDTWISIERTYTTPSATLLSGRQLERLSNGRYPAGGHRVVSYGPSEPRPKSLSAPIPASSSTISPSSNHSTPAAPTPKYRYSIVFVLRTHEPVIVNTDDLTTPITGEFEKKYRGVTAGEMFAQIRGAHFNINTGVKEREEQRRRLEERRRRGGERKIEGRVHD